MAQKIHWILIRALGTLLITAATVASAWATHRSETKFKRLK